MIPYTKKYMDYVFSSFDCFTTEELERARRFYALETNNKQSCEIVEYIDKLLEKRNNPQPQ